MPNERLTLQIETKTTGSAEVQQLSDALNKVVSISEKAGKSGAAFSSFPGAIKSFVQDPLGSAEKSLSSFASGFGPLGIGVAGGISALSAFAVASVSAVKSLAEFGIQTQNIALKTGLTTREVSAFSYAAKSAGADVDIFQTAMRKLSIGLTEGGEEGAKSAKAMAELGVRTHALNGDLAPMSSIFEQIGAGMRGVSEAAERNRLAVELFGRAGIELIPTLLTLNENVANFGKLGFGPSETDIIRFAHYNKELVNTGTAWDELKRKFKDGITGEITIAGMDGLIWLVNQTLKIDSTVYGAEPRAVGGILDRNALSRNGMLPPGQRNHLANPKDSENYLDTASLLGNLGLGTPDASAVFGEGMKNAADLVAGDANAKAFQKRRHATSIEAMGAEKEELEKRIKTLSEGIRPGSGKGLKVNQDDEAELDRDQRRVDQLNLQMKARERELQFPERIRKAQSENLLRSRETLAKSRFEPAAGRDLSDNLRKASSLVDEDGSIHRFELQDETRRNLETAFHVYALELASKASKSQIDLEEQDFARRQILEAAFWRKRREYSDETATLEMGTIDKTFSHENTLAGYSRDEHAGATALSGIGLTGSDAIRNSLSQISRRLGIDEHSLTEIAVNDAATIERNQQRDLIGVAAALKAGNIDKGQAAERYNTIYNAGAQQGTELNDRYAHDLLMAQQDAVIKTTTIIKDLENAQIDKVKSIAGGLFDALATRQPNAVPNFLKSQVLGVGQTITENLAGEAFKSVRQFIPHAGAGSILGKALEGTPFGPDPTKGLNGPAATFKTAAEEFAEGVRNFLSGKPAGVPGGSDGGYGIPANGSGYQWVGSPDGSISYGGTGADGLPVRSVNPALFPGVSGSGSPSAFSNFGSGASSVTSGYALSIASDPGFNAATRIGAGVGLAAAGAAAGYGIYSGLKQGGVGGDLKAAGSAAGLAGGIVSNVAKLLDVASPLLSAIPVVGSIAALALPLLGGLFNGPQRRANAIGQEISSNQYMAPTALNVTQSSSGTFTDFDARGNIRTSNFSPFPNVTNPSAWEQTHGIFGGPPTWYDVPGRVNSQFGPPVPPPAQVTNNYISTMDAASFADFAQRNHAAIGNAAATAIQNAHGRLSAEVQRLSSY